MSGSHTFSLTATGETKIEPDLRLFRTGSQDQSRLKDNSTINQEYSVSSQIAFLLNGVHGSDGFK